MKVVKALLLFATLISVSHADWITGIKVKEVRVRRRLADDQVAVVFANASTGAHVKGSGTFTDPNLFVVRNDNEIANKMISTLLSAAQSGTVCRVEYDGSGTEYHPIIKELVLEY